MPQHLWVQQRSERHHPCLETVLQWPRLSCEHPVSIFLTPSKSIHIIFTSNRLEESGVITDCRIRTSSFDPVLDYDFSASNVVGRIIMSSECLREVFQELDASSETVQLSLSPDSTNFRITTHGVSGIYHVDIPKESDVIEILRSTAPVSFK